MPPAPEKPAAPFENSLQSVRLQLYTEGTAVSHLSHLVLRTDQGLDGPEHEVIEEREHNQREAGHLITESHHGGKERDSPGHHLEYTFSEKLLNILHVREGSQQISTFNYLFIEFLNTISFLIKDIKIR